MTSSYLTDVTDSENGPQVRDVNSRLVFAS